jgi:hypothetical protein
MENAVSGKREGARGTAFLPTADSERLAPNGKWILLV